MFKSLSLKAKLLTGFIAVSLLLMVVGVVGFVGIKSLSNTIYSLAFESIPSIENLEVLLVRQERIKTAIRTLLSPYLSKEDRQRQFDNIQKARNEYSKAIEDYDKIPRTAEEDKLYKDFLEKNNILKESNNKLIERFKKLDNINDNKRYMEEIESITKEVMTGGNRDANNASLEALTKLIKYVTEYYGHTLPTNYINLSSTLIGVIIFVALVAFIFAILIGFILGNSISKSLSRNADKITSALTQVESASTELAATSEEFSSNASELASSVEEITSSTEELQATIESNTKNIKEVEGLTRENMKAVENLDNSMKRMEDAMRVISDSSKQIAKIIKVIDDIAFQTNILALNAAVEAARAGDAGRGFVVVAEQVKNLAQKSAEAAKETADFVEKVLNNVVNGENTTKELFESQKSVIDNIKKTEVILQEVSKTSEEQLRGVNQVTQAISQVNSVAQQTASGSEEIASAVQDIESQIDGMSNIALELMRIVKGDDFVFETKKVNKVDKKTTNIVKKSEVKEKVGDKSAKLAMDKTKVGKGKVYMVKPEEEIPFDNLDDF